MDEIDRLIGDVKACADKLEKAQITTDTAKAREAELRREYNKATDAFHAYADSLIGPPPGSNGAQMEESRA